MPVEIAVRTRESVTLTWEMHPQAYYYTVRRIHVARNGDRDDRLRAVVYDGAYSDHALQAGTEYWYEFTSGAAPGEDEPDEPADIQRCRVRTKPALEYPTALTWFMDFLAPTFRRHLRGSGYRWCPEWWRHPEVRYAIEQLWHAYEAKRPADHPAAAPETTRADWLLTYAWPALDRLTLADGPMSDCYTNDREGNGERHVTLDRADVQPLPHEVDELGAYPSRD